MADSCKKCLAHKEHGKKPLGNKCSVTFETEDSNSSHGNEKLCDEEKLLETKREENIDTSEEAIKTVSM